MTNTEIKKAWKKLNHKTKKSFWGGLYNPKESINKLNEDAFPTLTEWTEYVYGSKRSKEILRNVSEVGIEKLLSCE